MLFCAFNNRLRIVGQVEEYENEIFMKKEKKQNVCLRVVRKSRIIESMKS